jgi:hypothetical protein
MEWPRGSGGPWRLPLAVSIDTGTSVSGVRRQGDGQVSADDRLTGRRAVVRTVEMVAVFGLFPIALIPLRVEVGRWLIPILVVTAAGCSVVLIQDPTFDRRRLWNATGLVAGLRRMLRLVPVGAVALVVLTLLIDPTRLLGLARERPLLWAVVLILYPVLSAYPQELIFRTFFFHRYARLIGDPRWVIAGSALSFGLAHAFLSNWIAPVLSAIGGFLFARTYAHSASTLQASLEHAIWGDLVFTIGLGWYFYGGSLSPA